MKLCSLIMVSLLLAISGCKRFVYTDYKLDFDSPNDNLEYNVLNLMSNDSREVYYTIAIPSKDANNISVNFKDLPSTITAKVSAFTKTQNYNGDDQTKFTVTYTSVSALPATYHVHLFTKSKQGLYRDLLQDIKIIEFTPDNLLGKTFNVNDSLSDDPFNGSQVDEIYNYDMTVTKKPGGTPSEFIMSTMGIHYAPTLFTDVEASVDPVTGVITLPLQNLLGIMVSGQGQFIYDPQYYNKYRATIFYKYQSLSGQKYEGKATF